MRLFLRLPRYAGGGVTSGAEGADVAGCGGCWGCVGGGCDVGLGLMRLEGQGLRCDMALG